MLLVRPQEAQKWPQVCVHTPGDEAMGVRASEFICHGLYVREFLIEVGFSCVWKGKASLYNCMYAYLVMV